MVVKRKSVIARIMSFKMLFLVCILIAALFGPAFTGEFYRNYQIEKEIGSLKSEIDAMEKNNYELSKLVEYYNTTEFKEEEARKRLGVKKDGEGVVIVKQTAGSTDIKKTGIEIINNDNVPNYLKWWNFFFKAKG